MGRAGFEPTFSWLKAKCITILCNLPVKPLPGIAPEYLGHFVKCHSLATLVEAECTVCYATGA